MSVGGEQEMYIFWPMYSVCGYVNARWVWCSGVVLFSRALQSLCGWGGEAGEVALSYITFDLCHGCGGSLQNWLWQLIGKSTQVEL